MSHGYSEVCTMCSFANETELNLFLSSTVKKKKKKCLAVLSHRKEVGVLV